MDNRIFAIGDLHGCNLTFREMIFHKLEITKQDKIYLLGDYIDRGPRSKDVVDTIFELINNDYNIFCIMGNHESMLINAARNTSFIPTWYDNGGSKTLKSFGVTHPRELDAKYVNFFFGLPYYYMTDNFIIVHAGLNFLLDNPLLDTQSMLWTRNHYVDMRKSGGRKVVSGHTPLTLKEIRESTYTNSIRLDGGCVYYDRYPDRGHLCAVELNTMELFVQRNIDEQI